MTIQTINIGNVVNDGLGDDLRTAFQKVNANFSTLNSELAITGINLGTTGVGLFKQKTGANLEFKRLKESDGIQLDEYDSYIEVRNTAINRFVSIDTQSGTIAAVDWPAISIQGYPAAGSYRPDVDVTASGSTVRISSIIPVTDILTTYDFGTITGNLTNAMQLSLAWANIDFGELTLPATLDLDCGTIL